MIMKYRDTIKVLRGEIIKWLNVKVIPENQVGNTHDYPYITYYMYEDWLPVEFDPDSPNYNIQIQMKVVSANEEEQKDLKNKLRRLFNLSEPSSVLKRNGIALLHTDILPSPANYVENYIIFDDGWDFTFNVHAEEDDFTVGNNTLDTVNPNIEEE